MTYALPVLVVLAALGAYLFMRNATLVPTPALLRDRMTVRLTIMYVEPHDAWATTHAYFEGATFAACRARATQFLRDFAAGRGAHDLYRPFPAVREPRDILGADLCDEFRSLQGETVSYAYQPGEWA